MNKKAQKSFVSGVLILVTLIIFVVLLVMWLGYGKFTDSSGKKTEITFGIKAIFSIVGLVILLYFWLNYFRQKKVDRGEIGTNSTADKIIQVSYKVGGWSLRLKAIGHWVTSGVLIIISLLVFLGILNVPENIKLILGIILFIAGIVLIIFGYIYWYRSKSLVKGRFY